MKRVLLAFVLALVLPTTTQAASLSFNPPTAVVEVGQTFSLALEIEQVTDLAAASLTFEYNPAVIRPTGGVPGSLFTDAGCDPWMFVWPATGDSITVDQALLGCIANGSGTFVIINFVAVGSGVSDFSWRRGILRNSLNENIPVTWGTAHVMVLGPVPTAPSTWGKVKTKYR